MREGLGKFPRCQPGVRSYLWAYSSSSSSGLAQVGSFSRSALGRLTSPILASAETRQNERIVNVPSRRGLEAINGTG